MPADATALTPKARRTRLSLMEAGRKLAGLHGLEGVNVMAVCAEAGVGRTSFYNYFADVEGLIGAVATEASRKIKDSFDRLHADEPRGHRRLRACLKMILTLAVEDPETVLLLTSLAQASPEVASLLNSEIHAELHAEAEANIEDMQALSEFLAIATLALARQFAETKLAPESVDRHLAFLLRSTGQAWAHAL